MKIFNKIVRSKTEPQNKNDIWFDGSVFRLYSPGEKKEDAWKPFTIDLETAEKLKNIADGLSVYQEILIPGEGIIIDDNNVISVDIDLSQYSGSVIVYPDNSFKEDNKKAYNSIVNANGSVLVFVKVGIVYYPASSISITSSSCILDFEGWKTISTVNNTTTQKHYGIILSPDGTTVKTSSSDAAVDHKISGTSVNPISNKTIKEYVDNAIANIEISGGGGGSYDDSELRAELEEVNATAVGAHELATSSKERIDAIESVVQEANLSRIKQDLIAVSGEVDNLSEGKEDKSNKVITINSESTNEKYPSAKAVYNAIELSKYDDSNLSDEIGELKGKFNNEKEYTERRFTSAQETITMLSGAFDNFSNSITPATVKAMALLIGDKSLQFKFTPSRDSLIDINCPLSYDNSKKEMIGNPACLVHMTLGIESVTAAGGRNVTDYKRWEIATGIVESLDDIEARYVYVKASKNSAEAEYLLSPTSIKMEEVPDYYHFLVGVLNSEYNGSRDFVTLYGFTEVLPGQITTDVIKSADGNTYFNLKNGVICGNITFKTNAGNDKPLAEFVDEQENLINSVSAATSNLDTKITNIETGVEQSIKEINDKLDGVVESYFGEYIPSKTNLPASEWIGTESNHVGDTFTNTLVEGDGAGQSWRWLQQKDGTYDWQLIADSDAAKALALAGQAIAAADGKMSIFLEKPKKYSKGDMWIVDSDYIPYGYKKGDLLTATSDSSSYDESHWKKLINYANSETVQDVIDKSDAAQEAVEQALRDSASAKEVANAAAYVSNAAEALANAASKNASEAVTSSNTAQDIANDAKDYADEAKELANDAKTLADKAKEDAQNAKTEADAAKGIADAAQAQLTNWSADNVISPFEKQGIRNELVFVIEDKKDIDNQVDRYELSDTDAYRDFEEDWSLYKSDLEAIIHVFGSVDVPQNMSTHQVNYYAGRTAILEIIASAAKNVSDAAKTAAENAQEAALIAENLAKTLAETVDGLYIKVDYAQSQLDGIVINHYLKGEPKIDNYPAIGWFTDIEKLNHLGDTYINVSTEEQDPDNAGKAWRWCECTDYEAEAEYTLVVPQGVVEPEEWTLVGHLSTLVEYTFVEYAGVKKAFSYGTPIMIFNGPYIYLKVEEDGSINILDNNGYFDYKNSPITFYYRNYVTVTDPTSGATKYLHWHPIADAGELKRLFDVYKARNEVDELSFLKKAFNEGETYANGGLVLSDMVAVKEGNKVEAFINGSTYGEDSEHGKLLIAAGINDIEDPTNANTRIYEDGTVETNKLNLKEGCTIGNLNIGNGYIGVDPFNFGQIGELNSMQLTDSNVAFRRTYKPSDYPPRYIQRRNVKIDNLGFYASIDSYANGEDAQAPIRIGGDAVIDAFEINNGTFAGLRTKTKVLTLEGTEASPNLLTNLDFDILVNATSGKYYIALPGSGSAPLYNGPHDSQEYIITTKGADVILMSHTYNIWDIDYATSDLYLAKKWQSENTSTKAIRGAFRIKYYKDADQWIINWINKIEYNVS